MQTQKSFILAPHAMPAALSAGDATLGNPTWVTDKAADSAQAKWLDTYAQRKAEIAMIPEIQRHATTVAQAHGAWLQQHGWTAQITEGRPGDLFLASVLDILSRWQTPGRAFKEGDLDRVLLKRGVTAGETPQTGTHPVVQIATQTNDVIWLHQLDHVLDETSAMAHARQMLEAGYMEAAYVDFPMVDLQTRSSADHMIGLRTADGSAVISQAAEQFRFQMNHLGARGQAAAELAVSRSISMTPTVKITGPFMALIQRPSVQVAPMIVVCGEDGWKAPPADAI